MAPHLIEGRSSDYVRHGTTTLFAALEIATGHVTGALKPRHRRQELLAFWRQVARAYPGRELHLIMDNYAAHKTPEVKDWLAANPRTAVHFTPTHASWMNLGWFSVIERQAIHRGTYTSVKDLNAKIRTFIELERPRPPLRLDESRRRHPQESQPRDNFRHTALAAPNGSFCETGRHLPER